jgi:hypothetical protein
LCKTDIESNMQASRRGCDITAGLRVSAVLRGDSGISGTDASFASQRSRRPDEFVYNEVGAPRANFRGAPRRETCSEERRPVAFAL